VNPERTVLLVWTIARLLEGCRHVAVGARSPIPAAGALLARELSADRLHVSILGRRRHTLFTDGGRELFDCAAQGRIDAFFLGGVQIDGHGNVNLLGLGSPEGIERRFAGNFGGPYLGFLIPRLILFRTDHDPKTLVERVDFVSLPGSGPEGVYRRGGPVALLTDLCLFRFEAGRFRLESVHPGHTVADVRARTGFGFEAPEEPPVTPAPPPDVQALVRGPVAAAVGEVYPLFARELAAG
jgi:glutaconate CoA-transferase subunit B